MMKVERGALEEGGLGQSRTETGLKDSKTFSTGWGLGGDFSKGKDSVKM